MSALINSDSRGGGAVHCEAESSFRRARPLPSLPMRWGELPPGKARLHHPWKGTREGRRKNGC